MTAGKVCAVGLPVARGTVGVKVAERAFMENLPTSCRGAGVGLTQHPVVTSASRTARRSYR